MALRFMHAESPRTHQAQGYLHPTYAASLAEFGTPRFLPRCRGWVLERSVPSNSYRDAMGCYPLFCCEDWDALGDDLATLKDELVSVALVADPFGNHSPDGLHRAFRDVVCPFKKHYVVDLGDNPEEFVAAHHLRNARKALQAVEVEIHQQPADLLEDWKRLYATLITRHDLRGLHRFSAASFEHQLQVPGCTALAARREGEVVGMLLWYEQGEVAYYHLGAFSPEGYEVGASFALFHTALRHFAEAGMRWLNLGGGAGLQSGTADGLARFKMGWSTSTRSAYFCGRILNPARYEALSGAPSDVTFFPLYRQDEFRGSQRNAIHTQDLRTG